MAMNDVFDKHFLVSYDIIESYDLLASLLFSKECDKYTDDVKLILGNLKKLLTMESSKYNTIYLEDIMFYTNELKKIPQSWHDLVDFRICYRLACVYDRLRNYTINLADLFPEFNIDYELGIRDVINSKIEIDTYKLISNKLKKLCLIDEKSIDYKSKLLNLNNQYVVLKLCMRELEEIILLKYNFDIEKFPDIDLSIVEDKISVDMGCNTKVRDIVKDKIYNDVISLIDRLKIMTLDPNNIGNIYDNLFLTAHLEILLDYLDIDKLNEVSLYCDNICSKNMVIKNNVNRIVRKKIDIYR